MIVCDLKCSLHNVGHFHLQAGRSRCSNEGSTSPELNFLQTVCRSLGCLVTHGQSRATETADGKLHRHGNDL